MAKQPRWNIFWWVFRRKRNKSGTTTIDFIETLSACLTATLSRYPCLADLNTTDKAHLHGSSIALAILDNSLTGVTSNGTSPNTMEQSLRSDKVPEHQALIGEFTRVASLAKDMEEKDRPDTERLSQTHQWAPISRIDLVRNLLASDEGMSLQEGILAGEVKEFVSQVRLLSEKIARLTAFNEREGEVFGVLGARAP